MRPAHRSELLETNRLGEYGDSIPLGAFSARHRMAPTPRPPTANADELPMLLVTLSDYGRSQER
jgi:hypothetical protein